MLDPVLASMAPTAHLALEAFGQPPESVLESMARLLGLQGESSLRPWIEGETDDIEELARRDYEPAAGNGLNRAGFVGCSNSQIGWSHDEQNDEQVFA